MKLQTATNILIKQSLFLGFKNIGLLVEDMDKDLGPYPLGVIKAYKVYKELAYV